MGCDCQRFPDRRNSFRVCNTMHGYGLYESIPSLYESGVAKGVCATNLHVLSSRPRRVPVGLRCVSLLLIGTVPRVSLWSERLRASTVFQDGGPGPRHHWQLYGHRAQALSFQ